jgi:hypothetical protein
LPITALERLCALLGNKIVFEIEENLTFGRHYCKKGKTGFSFLFISLKEAIVFDRQHEFFKSYKSNNHMRRKLGHGTYQNLV